MTYHVRRSILIVLMAASLVVGCGKARHVAVQADAVFAQAVFALDDLEFEACLVGALSAAQCAQTNPIIKRALLEVRAITAALQATPSAVSVPADLPTLIADLAAVQRIVAAAGTSPTVMALADQTDTALGKAADLLKAFTGGR